MGGGRGASLAKVRVWCFILRMRVRSSINQSVLLEKSPFNITHSRSEIELSGLLKCLATGSPLLSSRMLLCDCSCGV